ncbi:MAG: hypothetical protein J0I79_19910 [Mesorhizobium sp.]|uniref:hypothetical protein n=1 Tax=Mesorhizobium sp. TaxID=1871066 RepID=UPI001AC6F33E|nr:hypothetical protein [Mesorhizobium sp.]MBN9220216.1 hypothetical protein [Mesorhizobium sp.]
MNGKPQPSGQTTVNVSQLARLLDLTPRRIQQLVQQGVIPKAGRDAYPFVGAVQAYLQWLTNEDRRAALAAPMAQLSEVRTREIELRIREKARNLIPIEDQRMTINTLLDQVKRELAEVPWRLPAHIRAATKVEIAVSIDLIEKAAVQAARMVETGRDAGS